MTAIRSPHFQEKVETVLGTAAGDAVYPVFGESADESIMMVATRDIGAAAAQFVLSPPMTDEVIALEAPGYTEREVAEQFGAALGRRLHVVTIPPAGWLDALTAVGVPAPLAGELVELYDAEHRGLLRHRDGRPHRCTTTLDETLGEIVAARLHRVSTCK